MRDNGKGLLAFNVVGLDIERNFITGSTDMGSGALRFEGGSSGVTIAHNTIVENLGAAVRISNRFTGPDTAFTINDNNFVGNVEGGVTIETGGFAGFLDATDNYWGSSFGPGGDGPGFGDAITANDADVDFDPWAVAPVEDAPPLGQAPRAAGQDVVEDLQNALDAAGGGDKDVRKKLNEVIDKLDDALDGSRWDDNSHLSKKGGDKAFDLQRDAAKKLMELLKNKKNFLSTRALGGILQRLADATRGVVEQAIDDAGNDGKKRRDALKELDKSEDDLAAGKFDAAIAHLKNAWKKALEANK